MNRDGPSFVERIIRLADSLEEADIPYAFGGAIALAYHAEPRATRDVDINVFVGVDEAARVLLALHSAGVPLDDEATSNSIRRDGQVRILWDDVPVDLFFSNVPFHDSCQVRVQRASLRGRSIPILSAEDLTVCKVMYDREKDWIDVAEMVKAQRDALDVSYVRRWLKQMLGEDEPRVRRFSSLTA